MRSCVAAGIAVGTDFSPDSSGIFLYAGQVMDTERIGIIAGSGQFPRLVAEGARKDGLGVVICGFHGQTDPSLSDVADAFELFSIGQFARVLNFLQHNGVRRLCMAGAISKPRVMDLRPDAMALKLLFSLRNNKGDDALLRGVVGLVERAGIAVVGAADLVPSLLCPSGVLGRVKPDAGMREAVAFGWPRLALMGKLDIGQCIVVRDGMVAAVECIEGTDATLRRAGALGLPGCVALKMPKPGQEERVDLPSVGLKTIEILVEGRFSGLVVEAGRTLFFDRPAALELADRNNICVLALTREESEALAVQGSLPLEGIKMSGGI